MPKIFQRESFFFQSCLLLIWQYHMHLAAMRVSLKKLNHKHWILRNHERQWGIDYSELGSIVSSCKNILGSSTSSKIKHVHREVNIVAHWLATIAEDFPNLRIWNGPPSFTDGLFHRSCSCQYIKYI